MKDALKKLKKNITIAETIEDFDVLVNIIEAANEALDYIKKLDTAYRKGDASVSDFDFDLYLTHYNQFYDIISGYDLSDEDLPKLKDKFVFTSIEKSKKLGKGKIKHVTAGMLGTLLKANSIEEMMLWYDAVCEGISESSFDYVIELKYDGNSVDIVYTNKGDVITAFTRGKDGAGEDLTEVFKGHKISVPANLCEKQIEIRYEAVLTDDNFEGLMEAAVKTYANNRSAVAGILGKSEKELARTYISLVPLDILLDGTILGRNEQRKIFDRIIADDSKLNTEFGIDVITFEQFKNNAVMPTRELFEKHVTKLYEQFNDGKRFSYDVMVDGFVVKVVDAKHVLKLGNLGESPKWAMALKFDYLEKETKVIDIHLYVGKTTRCTPVVEFEPIEFYGAVQQRVSLSNYKRFNELELAKDDVIRVSYRNDVISYVEGVSKRSGNEPIELNYVCPKCESDLYVNEKETFLFCSNKKCPGRVLGKMERFCVGTGMKGIRYKTLEKLFNEDIIKTVRDFYQDEQYLIETISDKEGFGPTSAIKFVEGVNSIKYSYDWEILGSFSFEGVGRTRCKEVCKLYNIEDLQELYDNDELETAILKIPGFAKILAKNFSNGLIENIREITEIFEALEIKDYKEDFVSVKEPKKFVITGEFNNATRPEVKKMLESKGHKVVGSVSKNTDYLVTNDTTSGTVKNKDAKKLGVPIINEGQLFEMFLK